MMTPDDKSKEGNSRPSLFPARGNIIEFCSELKISRNVEKVCILPELCQGNYTVKLHNGNKYLTRQNRSCYFSGISEEVHQLVFLDPDNGFEPEKLKNEKHILFSEIDLLLRQVSNDSIISVFHHFRRVPFPTDFQRIKERLYSGYATAIYWNFLMFVVIAKSQEVILRVLEANKKYSLTHPVKLL